MANTGKQRSLTVVITKTIAGVLVEGYPRTYYGRDAFSFNGVNYLAILPELLATMPVATYEARLTAFQGYVESLELGLNLATDIVEGDEPYRNNITACPIL